MEMKAFNLVIWFWKILYPKQAHFSNTFLFLQNYIIIFFIPNFFSNYISLLLSYSVENYKKGIISFLTKIANINNFILFARQSIIIYFFNSFFCFFGSNFWGTICKPIKTIYWAFSFWQKPWNRPTRPKLSVSWIQN